MAKITFIGAGSVVFAKTLIGDILQFPELSSSTICLMDIDASRLKVAEVMARRIIAKLNVPAKVVATLDRTEAIRDASYVICTIQVGGYKPGTVLDFEIPKKYGLRQTIADTLGVGGVFRGLRTIPEMVKIAEDIATVAKPGCIFLNYTNPMAINCWAVDRAVGIPHVGLCHSVQGTSKELAAYCGIPYEDLVYKAAGINHMAFFLKLEYRNQDAYPLLFKAMEDPAIFRLNKVRFEMMRRLGYFVTESSEHQSEYVPYFLHHGEEIIKKFDIPLDEYIRRCEAIISTWETAEQKLLGEDGEIQVAQRSHEYGAFIIHACETNRPKVIYGNVPNRGLITNLPEGCCVEVPCLVDGNGIQGTHVGNLPPQLAAICQSNINVQALTVEAALTGKREHIYHAVMMDPHTSATLTLDKIWAMCDDLIEAHQKEGLLPEYAPVVRNTGRSYQGTGDQIVVKAAVEGAFDGEKGARSTLVVEAENPRSEDVELTVRLVPGVTGVKVLGSDTLQLRIPAAGTVRQTVSLENTDRIEEPVKVALEGSGEQAFLLAATLKALSRLGVEGDKPADFSVWLRGDEAAQGSIGLSDEGVVLDLAVNDSMFTTAKLGSDDPHQWTGSWIRAGFAIDDRVTPEWFIICPQKEKSTPEVFTRLHHLVKNEKVSASQDIGKTSYRIRAVFPYEALGFQSDISSFLFNLQINLCALGEAHYGGFCDLNSDAAPSMVLRR